MVPTYLPPGQSSQSCHEKPLLCNPFQAPQHWPHPLSLQLSVDSSLGRLTKMPSAQQDYNWEEPRSTSICLSLLITCATVNSTELPWAMGDFGDKIGQWTLSRFARFRYQLGLPASQDISLNLIWRPYQRSIDELGGCQPCGISQCSGSPCSLASRRWKTSIWSGRNSHLVGQFLVLALWFSWRWWSHSSWRTVTVSWYREYNNFLLPDCDSFYFQTWCFALLTNLVLAGLSPSGTPVTRAHSCQFCRPYSSCQLVGKERCDTIDIGMSLVP